MSEAAASGPASFRERLDGCIGARRADGQPLAVLLVDCAMIARIDGVWGYPIGDAVRNHLGARLRTEALRAGDFVGETGRDEFACVLDTLPSSGVALLAAEKILRSLDLPVWIGEEEIYARPAIGIAVFPEHGDSAVALLRHAKTACRVGRERSDRVGVYTEGQEGPETELLLFENHLRAAITQNALELMFQPQIELRSGLVVGAESVLHWRDTSLGVVPVEKAIAAAESAGLVNQVTLWMLNDALRNCVELRQTTSLDLRVAVNLSAKCLREPDLPDFVARALQTWNVRPSRLALEVTETAILQASPEAGEALRRLKALGVRLAIDDSSAGFGLLAYLASLPFDEMKINLAGMRELLRVPQQRHIVQALIDLAHRLKLEVCAEGVEDETVAAQLKEFGCDYLQGPHISAPLDPAGFARTFGMDR